MNKNFLKNAIGWGFLLWLIGYILGFVFFFILPPQFIGWTIMPIGIALTLWVLFKKINNRPLKHYLIIAIAWTLIAVILDYLLLVKMLKPTDGYYKFDVYFYYGTTFILPILVGFIKKQRPATV
jgi:hypothetical protein